MISFSGTVTIKILGGISFWSPVLFSKILSTIRNETNESARFRLLFSKLGFFVTSVLSLES